MKFYQGPVPSTSTNATGQLPTQLNSESEVSFILSDSDEHEDRVFNLSSDEPGNSGKGE